MNRSVETSRTLLNRKRSGMVRSDPNVKTWSLYRSKMSLPTRSSALSPSASWRWKVTFSVEVRSRLKIRVSPRLPVELRAFSPSKPRGPRVVWNRASV